MSSYDGLLENFTQPHTVTVLGDNWPDRPHFYADSNLYVYVCDELARIQRLIEKNEDCRSAFLRAGGLNEVVMMARLAKLNEGDLNHQVVLDTLDKSTPFISSVFKQLTASPGSQFCIVEEISKKGNVSVKIKEAKDATKNVVCTINLAQSMTKWWSRTTNFSQEDGWEEFLDRRNKLAHTYFSVGRDEACDALKFVTANIEDFYGKPVADLNVQTSAMTWGELCTITELAPFLPPNLR